MIIAKGLVWVIFSLWAFGENFHLGMMGWWNKENSSFLGVGYRD